MYKINWNQPLKSSKSGLIIDIGDIRLLLKEHSDHWQLDMGIRAYNQDRSTSMVRPPVNVIRFSKPCDIEKAKVLTEEYGLFHISSNNTVEINGINKVMIQKKHYYRFSLQ